MHGNHQVRDPEVRVGGNRRAELLEAAFFSPLHLAQALDEQGDAGVRILLVTTGAFAVIGAILGFLAGTFLKVLIGANVEAWRNGERSS